MTSSEDRNDDLSQAAQFENFIMGVEQGQPISEVDPIELKRLVMAPGMSRTVAGPLWLRYVFLGFLVNQGLLAEWQRGTELR